MSDFFKNKIFLGDCLQVMKKWDDNIIDTIITDPPYALPGGFMGKTWDNYDGREDVGFGYWLAGFTDGEGCFRVHKHSRGTHSCAFQIKIRYDDKAVLERIRKFVGFGRIDDEKPRNGSKKQSRYVVDNKDGCEAIVGLFRKFPLTAKKALDFDIWANAVEEWINRKPGNRWDGHGDQTQAILLKKRIEDVRKYVDIPWSGHKYQDWCRQWAKEVLRIAKPGAVLLAFGGTRTYHRLTCAIEDAGWEIKDCMMWLYGSGFPKSTDISKAIDKKYKKERKVIGTRKHPTLKDTNKIEESANAAHGNNEWKREWDITEPATELSKKWEGWGTALKPAWEPIILAMKPVDKTYANNAEQHNVAGLWIDGGRVGDEYLEEQKAGKNRIGTFDRENMITPARKGRFPANLILDEETAKQLDMQTGTLKSGDNVKRTKSADDSYHGGNTGAFAKGAEQVSYGDQGGASRFFYCAKASTSEKTHSKQVSNDHPAVKPIKLMEYLCNLTKTPNGGIVFDPFAGSGSTLVAAINTNRDYVGIEKDEHFFNIINKRINITKEQLVEDLDI